MSDRPKQKVKGGHRVCVICGINERKTEGSVFFASFPTDENRCKEWLRVTGKEELVHLPIEKLHQLKHICSAHFRKKDFYRNGTRLKSIAIPSQNLTAEPLSAEQFAEFPLHMWNFKGGHHSKGVIPSTSQLVPGTSSEEAIPSTSQLVPGTSTEEAIPSSSQLIPGTSTSPLKPYKDNPFIVTSTRMKKEALVKKQKSDEQMNPRKSVKRSAETDLELTPRKKKLVETLKRTKCTLQSLRSSCILLEKIQSPALRELIINLTKNKRKKPKGRRWTTQHKISALSIYKRSPRTYRHLMEIGKGAFPSEKTLQNIIKKIPMQPGINKAALNYLEKISKKKSVKNKQCCLLFDEMAIKPRLIYNSANDVVEGFEDFGEEFERTHEMADHALVFMLQGLCQKFKQPIAYFFVKGTITSQKLAVLIKRIINKVNATGFNIINTVCDQGPTNLGALKLLREMSGATERNNYFTVNGKQIYIIYDVPHLFKSLRNNFVNNGEVTLNGKKASWNHILKVEEKNRNFLYLTKIKPIHVNLKFRSKMKVKYAAQILSNTVHAVLKMMYDAEKEKNLTYANELLESALVIKELDTLFDVTNGPAGPDDIKPGLRVNCSLSSKHLNIWSEWIKKLDTLKFGKAKNIKCISGYITTLQSLKDVWNYLHGIGFKHFNLRQVNQDSLENLFGVIRQHSPTNKNPTCSHFISALKTAVITNMTGHHSRGSNCQKDELEILTNFQTIVFDEEEKENIPIEYNTKLGSEAVEEGPEEVEKVSEEAEDYPVISIPDINDTVIEEKLGEIQSQPVVYISGYIAFKILKSHNCEECKKNLCVAEPDPNIHMYIMLREWWPEKLSLTYPTFSLCSLVQKITIETEQQICPKLHENNLSELSATLYTAVCDTAWFKCINHKDYIFKKIYKLLSSLLIRRQCQRINQGLALQEEALASAQKQAQHCIKIK